MLQQDALSEILDDLETVEQEDAVLVEGFGTTTLGIDWQTGRLFKANAFQTKVERVIKYLVTPRGQVEVYRPTESGILDVNSFDEGYGSLAWTLAGRVYDDEDTAKEDLQALCDEAALNTEGIEQVVVDALTLEENRLIARIRVVVETGEEVTVNDVAITN